jgi:5-methylcytosine-specific restriction protein A
MIKVSYVVFRYLTFADFYNIYKPSGSEARGGGQTYIDFGIGSVTRENWKDFFRNAINVVANREGTGIKWEFTIKSIGINRRQEVTIYQRREQTFSIAAQRIGSDHSNRVWAWHPDYGFPAPIDPSDRQSRPDDLAVYLVRCDNGTIWAGWFQGRLPCRDANTSDILRDMTNENSRNGYSGFLDLTQQNILLDERSNETPFFSQSISESRPAVNRNIRRQIIQAEETTTDELLDNDLADSEINEGQQRRRVQLVLQRNKRAVRDLKRLYNGECQISGDQFTFMKLDGNLYSEAHHLIPLGLQGADSPFNIIIVSPLIHRMLHYASVEGLDLSRISDDNTLEFQINGQPYTLRWHPSHAALVRRHQQE